MKNTIKKVNVALSLELEDDVVRIRDDEQELLATWCPVGGCESLSEVWTGLTWQTKFRIAKSCIALWGGK